MKGPVHPVVARRRPKLPKLLASIAVLGAAAGIAGLGTFAVTSTTSASHTVSSGTVTIASARPGPRRTG